MKKSKFLIYHLSICFAILFIVLSYVAVDNIAVQTSQAKVNKENLPIIVIDAGHGGEDGGAVSSSGVLEKDINLDISLKLKDIFLQSGFNVVTTRESDISICDDSLSTVRERKVSDLKNRLEIFNKNKNSLVISIHQNKFTDSKYSGTQIFFSPNNPQSSILAENVKKRVVELLQPNNTRECKKADGSIYILKNTNTTSIIVECGFLSNKAEADLLSNDKYQSQMAFTIFLGTMEYINGI